MNPTLPVPALAKAYQLRQRIQIADLLAPGAAEALYRVLAEQTTWNLVHHQPGVSAVVLSGVELAAMSAEEKAARLNGVLERARDGFSFLYRVYPLSGRYLQREDLGHPLHAMLAFINAPAFLDLVRAVTGINSIVKADAQATLYGPGDFLTRHDDKIAATNRRVAYVIGMSKGWKADWGGLLQFYDGEGGIDQVFVPKFNSLMLFTVPQMHAVTPVASYAPMARYSITGWFIDP